MTDTTVAAAEPSTLALGYESQAVGRSCIVLADCFEWLAGLPNGSLHAIVTDPPWAVREFDDDQLAKRADGSGGLWRQPMKLKRYEKRCRPSDELQWQRSPQPRFTDFGPAERKRIGQFFTNWARLAVRALLPGAHVFIASNSFLAPLVYSALVEGGLEFRGQVIRLVRTLRGGDRPKGSETEFAGVSTMPRAGYEPWGIFRRRMPSRMTVAECLRRHGTGGLRRTPAGLPLLDVVPSEVTPMPERRIAAHPSLKPQAFLRQVVHAALPLGVGIVADPFMGSGSIVAAAEAVGYSAIGVERYRDFYQMAVDAVPRLSAVARGQR